MEYNNQKMLLIKTGETKVNYTTKIAIQLKVDMINFLSQEALIKENLKLRQLNFME